ncbi:hypothetical protein IQ235_03930 [Oscillatoriales cyanobacterium LEGE 11467]|uniref:Uncharacterized protein n=1 Tax=Zarconia navalis LEGE 11467 TaxID=1828826 RepID=A0A928Z8K5_9CYAN|nr:hypothetical protein [Zarconia navalis]MBE9039941.1 hypothetical protein [Zarconia navalis LEGE 11467]
MVTTYYPDVLPSNTASLVPKTKPISRRSFSQDIQRSYRLVLRDESLAIDYVTNYRNSILIAGEFGELVTTTDGHPKKRPLTPYHTWVLKRIAKKFADTRSETLVIYALKNYPEQFSFLTYLETLRNAKKNKQRRQRTRRRCRIVRAYRTA